MPTTPSGIPYSLPTDAPDYPTASEALADHLETRMPRRRVAGIVAVPVSNANNATAVVTFPAGLFTAAPTVVVSTSGTSFWCAFVPAYAAASMTVQVRHIDGTVATATPSVHYQAEQG